MMTFFPRVDSTLIVIAVSITCFRLASFFVSLLSLVGRFLVLFSICIISTLLVLTVNWEPCDAWPCERQCSNGGSQFSVHDEPYNIGRLRSARCITCDWCHLFSGIISLSKIIHRISRKNLFSRYLLEKNDFCGCALVNINQLVRSSFIGFDQTANSGHKVLMIMAPSTWKRNWHVIKHMELTGAATPVWSMTLWLVLRHRSWTETIHRSMDSTKIPSRKVERLQVRKKFQSDLGFDFGI